MSKFISRSAVVASLLLLITGCGGSSVSDATTTTAGEQTPTTETTTTIAPTTTTEATTGTAGPGSVDISASAAFGDVELDPGFVPDPTEVAVYSGGSVDVSYIDGCTGWAATAPDLELDYGPGGDYLRIYFQAEDGIGDATIIINGPDGEWYCNDDFEGFDPAIEFIDPESGVFDIWIGSFSEGDEIDGIIGITEFSS